jgi:hypothetical protein
MLAMNTALKKVLTLLLLAGATAVPASPSKLDRFIGAWQAVDPDDGSLQTLTISRHDNSTVNLLVHDSYFALCDGDRGLGQGTGVIVPPRTLKVADYRLTCFPSGATKGGPTTLTLNRDGTLTRVLAPPSPSITYFRYSH